MVGGISLDRSKASSSINPANYPIGIRDAKSAMIFALPSMYSTFMSSCYSFKAQRFNLLFPSLLRNIYIKGLWSVRAIISCPSKRYYRRSTAHIRASASPSIGAYFISVSDRQRLIIQTGRSVPVSSYCIKHAPIPIPE